MKRWGNSILEINHKFISCDYCGNNIKDGEWFKIRKMNGSVFIFDFKLCEKIFDKKHGIHP